MSTQQVIHTGRFDKHGRPVMAGDLLKIYHFTTTGFRKIYMYKIAADVPGLGFRAVDVIDLATKGLQSAHSCSLDVFGDFEIIAGRDDESTGRMVCWWERDRVKR